MYTVELCTDKLNYVCTQFNNVCTIHEMYVAICTLNISYTNLISKFIWNLALPDIIYDII